MVKRHREARRRWLIPVILATQENHGSKPALANTLRDPILKKIHHKKGQVDWLKV
jgi:hypothetical protein